MLDAGCGWGIALNFLPRDCQYFGFDPTQRFLQEIKKRHPHRKTNLQKGKLPNEIPSEFKKNSFDVVLNSMVLHCVKDLETSIKNLFSRVKPNGEVVLIDFNNSAENLIREKFEDFEINEKNHLKGKYNLSEDKQIQGEVWLHQEQDLERELQKYSSEFTKEMLGPIFVGYRGKKSN